jgi:hypothetical protein
VFLLRKANLDPLFSPLPAVRQHHIIYNPNFKLYITLGYENCDLLHAKAFLLHNIAIEFVNPQSISLSLIIE